MHEFKLKTGFTPKGDQPKAIEQLTEGIIKGLKHQVLLGVTGSGKTFTVANVVANVNKPTLVIAHNKALATQLYGEFKKTNPHATVPQIGGMYEGDRSRKQTLVDYGFRLPSALDNRPLKFEEFDNRTNQVIYVSATPAEKDIQECR